jgi:predicted hydrocarbon binding protein
MGLGKMEISGDAGSGKVTLQRSHVDSGWQKKWGNNDKPVNHFTRGYIAAIFGASFDKPARSYRVTENTGMVTGTGTSTFTVEKA